MERGLDRKVEYLPANDDPASWREKLLFESFTLTPLPEPVSFLSGLLGEQAGPCGDHRLTTLFDGVENGFDTTVMLLECPYHELTKDGRITMVKAIRGNDAFYVIVRERATTPATATPESDPGTVPADFHPGTVIDWSQWFRRIRLCDDAEPAAHPCPEAAPVTQP